MMLRAIVLSLAMSSPAFAAALQADGSSGKLEFSGTQAGAKFTGSFQKFRVKLDFDPANPAQKCTASLGGFNAEGRCIPSCVPAIQAQASRLAQDDCTQAGTLCAPCYDPITGADTGACTQAGDAPVPAGGREGCAPSPSSGDPAARR